VMTRSPTPQLNVGHDDVVAAKTQLPGDIDHGDEQEDDIVMHSMASQMASPSPDVTARCLPI
jgi:hypothetical protein